MTTHVRRLSRTRVAAGLTLSVLASAAAIGLAATAEPAAAADSAPTPVTVSAPAGGSVTAAQATGLVNQTVHVSWTGFKPSSTPIVHPASTEFVVRVYECRGAAPTGPQDCYGSSVYKYEGQSDPTQVLPDGPTNALDAATDPSGNGGVDIEIRTSRESSSLGCDIDHACSLAVIPNYGDPSDHSSDFVFATTSYMDSTWAWANHVTIPIAFGPTGDSCPLGASSISLNGSAMLERAVTSWQPVICHESGGTALDYTSVGEPQGRAQFLSGAADIGLTSEPNSTATSRKFRYAPLSVDGIAIAFHVDDATTGQPITSMTLTPRLVAKLLTESYGENGYVAAGSPVGNGNPATVGNPYSIFTDPEFLSLNAGHDWPSASTNPLVVSGNQDMIYELTRWLAADPATQKWLAGTPDEHGMHVNTNFKGVSYPATSIELRDPYSALSYTFVPLEGLSNVARSLVANQPSSSSPTADELGRHAKDPQQLPGARSLIAIVDTSNASAFNFPVAAIRNAAGKDVTPTAGAMTAELGDMTKTPAGTLVPNPTNTDPAAYPLTMVQYAMVPTGNAPAATVSKVTAFLTYAADKGQVTGGNEGGLPDGYLPLTATLKSQLTATLAAVRSQSDTVTGTGDGPPSGSSAPGADSPAQAPADSSFGGTGDGSTDTPIDGNTDAPVPTPTVASSAPGGPNKNGSTSEHVKAVNYTPPKASAGQAKLIIPLVIAAAVSTALLGPLLLALGNPDSHVTALFGRARRMALPWRRS